MSSRHLEILVIVVMLVQIPVVVLGVALISSDRLTEKIRERLTRRRAGGDQ